MATINGDQLRGHLEGLVLASLESGAAYGWDIWQKLEAAGGGALTIKEGSLYPALYRLERQGLVAARWETTTAERPGPRRRLYRLTAKGRRRLNAAREHWREFVNVLGSLLFGSPGMKALRVQVERVVRPIVANPIRKDRMREELLSHLVRLFESEFARTNDTQSAVAEAIRRFGDAASLTRELQASVPWLERWAWWRFPVSGPLRRRPGESLVDYLLRANGWAAALGVGCYALISVVAIIAGRLSLRGFDRTSADRIDLCLMGTVLLQSASMFALALICERIRQALEHYAAAATGAEQRRAVGQIAGYTCLSGVVIGSATAGLMLLMVPIPFLSAPGFWWIIAGSFALALPLTLGQSWSWRSTTRRFENWDSLDLDEQPTA